jgi:hypothetical protein
LGKVSRKLLAIVEDDASTKDSTDHKNKWELVDDNTDPPRLDNPAPEKLTILIRHKETDVEETFTFSNGSVHWSDKSQIAELAKWRTQTFRSRGIMVRRANNMFQPAEDAWMMLLHLKLKGVVEAGHNIKLAGPTYIVEAFNNFFEDKVLPDCDGVPCEARDETSIKGRLGHEKTGVRPMREAMRNLLEGKKGGALYVPVITEGELAVYRKDGTVVVDDPGEEGKNAVVVVKASPKEKRKRDGKDVGGGEEKKRVKA